MGTEDERRLSDLESKVALLEQQIEHGKDMHQLLLDDMSRLLTRHDHILVGSDGDSGVIVDVKALKDEKLGERMRKLETAINRWGGALTLATFSIPLLIKYFWG